MVARHVGRSASYLFAVASALVIAGLGVAAAMLGIGPLSLDFLADDLASALQRQVPGYQVEIGGASLYWDGERRGLAVRLDDVSFDDEGGETALNLPALAVDLDRKQLLAGNLRPTGVAIEGARIDVKRRADGKLDWSTDDGAGGSWQALVDDAIAEGAGLAGIDIRGATVRLADEASGGSAEVRRADLSLTRLNDAIEVRLKGAVALNGQESPVEISTLYRPASALSVVFRFADLRPSDAAAGLAITELATLLGVDVPLTGELHVGVDAEGIARHVRFDVAAAAGTINVAALPAPAGLTRASAAGVIDLVDGRIDIARLDAALADGTEINVQGEVVLAEAGIGAGIVAHMRNLPTDSLAAYWPADAAVGARSWIVENLRGGEVTSAKLIVEAEPGELEAEDPRADLMRLSFDFDGLEARYWEPLPRMTGGKGSATLDLNRFQLRLARGRVGNLTVGEGKVTIDDLLASNQSAVIEFVAQGSAAEALALLDREPLGFAGDLDLVPSDVGGQANVWAGFTIPLRNDLALDDIGYRASAALSAFAVPTIFGRYAMSEGELTLGVDATGIDAEGTAALNGLPVSLSWRRDFGVVSTDGTPVYPDRYGFAGRANVADFAAIGLDLTMLGSGPVATQMNLWISATGTLVATGEANLTETDITSLMLRWRKPPQTPANATFRLSTDEAGLLRLDDLVFVSGTDAVQLSADFGPGADLRKMYFPVLRLGGQDLAATIAWPEVEGAPLRVDVGGRVLDARPFLEESEGERGGTLAAELHLAVQRLQLADATMLTDTEGNLSVADGGLDKVRLDGRLNGTAPVTVHVGTGVDHRDVVLLSDDAGAVLRALDVFEDAEGGALRIRGRVPRGPGATSGHVSATDVQVRRAPLLAQVLSLGSISGIQDVLSGEGVALRQLDLPFTMTDDELVVNDGLAVGPDIGLTVAGSYDRTTDEIDFAGTLVPTYTLNQILGRIPVIGDILVGGKGEGVFAVTYRVVGPAESPSVNVNPLTVLAPGIFRRLVDALTPGGAAAGGGEPLPERERPNLR